MENEKQPPSPPPGLVIKNGERLKLGAYRSDGAAAHIENVTSAEIGEVQIGAPSTAAKSESAPRKIGFAMLLAAATGVVGICIAWVKGKMGLSGQ